jgi:hypothetical protein
VEGVGVSAIFDREHVETLGGFGGGVDASIPQCLVQSADVASFNIASGSVIEVPNFGEAPFGSPSFWGGNTFTVRNVRHDGTGMAVLVLELT